MKKREALHLIEIVAETYNMAFDEKKIDIWIDVLTKEGDYKQSLTKLYNFIKQNKYKPTVSDILAIKPKEFVAEEKPKEETHQYKLKHDPEYAEEWRKVKERGFQLLQELKADD
ncbi:hypothetical protein JGZ41_10375 [Staphylococcus pseudintermedius]|uniref:Phage protein n=7 Tax=root TaxID=1 RepID=A0A494WIH0_9CAUD|nr:hypothetical protein [Staphylococcus pseudintermedius]YP_010081669.1 helicase loader [Staphylococcus phage SN8]YP_010081761.1 helicase loader [Staphylococcus phage SP197]APD19779.1 hypothetical protein SpT5_031 [Staphylococcus phage SpT5]ASU01226.1 hypothetical protein [Staphylococcus phage SN13]ASU01295.1 hypothetical protein [Staphylococcus phage SN11]ASU01364.1 hypothetical protein [Staphylococcus phage SN10]ASU01433.1 hypothetical protein [Staphylococcus phage SN8]